MHTIAMVSFTTFVLALVSLGHVSLGKEVRPDRFPPDCKAELADTKQELKLIPLRTNIDTILGCFYIGGKCTSDRDCARPSRKVCQAESPNEESLPGRAYCVEGVCRHTSISKGYTCSCLVGCSDLSFGLVRLSCVNGKCDEPACAECGDKPNGRRCCGSGIVDRDGRCYCAEYNGDLGCLAPGKHCEAGTECCRGGAYDGKCCRQCSNPFALCTE